MRPSTFMCLLAGLAAATVISLAGGARAELFNASPGSDLVSILAGMQDGDELLLQAGRYEGGLTINGVSVQISGPETGSAVIVPSQRANFLISLEGGGAADLRNLAFAPSEAAPFSLYVRRSEVSCTNCTFSDTSDTPIHVEAGALVLTDSVVENVSGNAIVAVQGSSVSLENVAFRDVAEAALIAQEAASTALRKVDIDAGSGVLISNAGGSNAIEETRIVARKDVAFQLEGDGNSTIRDCRLESVKTGLIAILRGSASARIVDTTVTGPAGAVYMEGPEGTPHALSIEDSVLLATGEKAYALRLFRTSADITKNVILSSGNGVYVGEDVEGILGENIIVANDSGVVVHESAGAANLRSDVIVTAKPHSNRASLDLGTIKLLGAISANHEAVEVMNASSRILLAQSTRADDTALTKLREAAADLRQYANQIATLQLTLSDAAGRERPAPFTVFDAAGNIIADAADGSPVVLAPGIYWAAPNFDLRMRTRVEIEEGQAATERIEIARSLWLAFANSDGSGSPILFQALPVAEARRLIRGRNFGYLLESIRAFPRPEAKPEDIAHALKLAREELMRLQQMHVSNPANLESRAQARTEARRILAIYGDESDVELLLRSALPIGGDDVRGAVAAAYAEARLGRLVNGVVRAELDTNDPQRSLAAAEALWALGHPDVDAYLLRRIESGAYEHANLTLHLARSLGHSVVTNTYKRVVATFIKETAAGEEPYFPYDALEHLVAFGNVEDWKLLAQAIDLVDTKSHNAIAVRLAPYAIDPLLLTDRIASYAKETEGIRNQVLICPALRLRGRDAFESINRGMQDQIDSWYGRIHYIQYYLEAGGCWPNALAAEYYHAGETKLAGNYTAFAWMPEPWHEKEMLDREAAGTLGQHYFDLVDFVPYERIAAAYAAASETKIVNPQLRLAYRKVLTRAGHFPELHAFEDGLERRPYLLRHFDASDYSGAISGMAVVDPQLEEDGDLVIRLRLEQVPYYHGCCDLASKIAKNNDRSAWLHAPYLDDGGSMLVKSIRLTRFGANVPIKVTGPHARGWHIAAEPSPDGFAGLVLTVELELFGDRRQIIYDLFASARARGFTRDPG